MKYNIWGLEIEGDRIKAALCENPSTTRLDAYAADMGFIRVLPEKDMMGDSVFYGIMTKERYEEYVEEASSAVEKALLKLSDETSVTELHLSYAPYVKEVKYNAGFTEFEITIDYYGEYMPGVDPSMNYIYENTELYHRLTGLNHAVCLTVVNAKSGEIMKETHWG
jgi:hypothetical protein